MCCKCEVMDDLSVDYEQCGKRVHMFWQDHVGELLIVSGSPDHSRTRSMLFHTILEDTMHSPYQAFGTEMGPEIDNGRKQNSKYGCGESPLSGFA